MDTTHEPMPLGSGPPGRIEDISRYGQGHLVDGLARGDAGHPSSRAAERQVRAQVFGDRDPAQQLAPGRDVVDARRHVGVLARMPGEEDPGGGPEVAPLVEPHAIPATAPPEVED